MNKKEKFERIYETALEYIESEDLLQDIGINIADSDLNHAFYSLFNLALKDVLTDEGLKFLYNEILFQEYSMVEILEALEEFFIKD